MLRDPPAPEAQTAVIRDFLASGSAYARGYEAAFRMDAFAELEGATVPVRFLCREDDLLYPHLDRLPPCLPRWGSNGWARPSGARRPDRRHLRRHGRHGGAGARLHGRGPEGGALRALAPGLLARCYGAAGGDVPPLVLLPDLPGSLADWDALALREAGRRQVIAIHLPGCGVSPPSVRGGTRSIDRRVPRPALPPAGSPASTSPAVAPGPCWRCASRPAGRARRDGSCSSIRRPSTRRGRPRARSGDRARLARRPSPGGLVRGARPGRSTGPGTGGRPRRRGCSARASTCRRCMRPSGRGCWRRAATSRWSSACWPRPRHWRPGTWTGCAVVLRQGDPDNASLGGVLAAAGASVATAHYDDLAEVTAAAFAGGLRSPLSPGGAALPR